MEYRENFKTIKGSYAEFIKMDEYFAFCPIADSSRTLPDGFNEADKIAVWSKKGKTFLVRNFS